MHLTKKLTLAQISEIGARVLELPYENEKVSIMFAIVPKSWPILRSNILFIFVKWYSFLDQSQWLMFGKLSMFVVLPNDDTDIRQVQSKLEQFDVAQINDQLAKVR